MSLGYFGDLSSAPTGVRMHIMHMHIAMVVMRIGSNIVLPLYKTSCGAVKHCRDFDRPGAHRGHYPLRDGCVLLYPRCTRQLKSPAGFADDACGGLPMQIRRLLLLVFVFVSFALPALAVSGNMEKAMVFAMRKIPCPDNPQAMRSASVAAMFGGEVNGDCMEYELRTEKVNYVIRPRNSVLLLLGSTVTIRPMRGELVLRSSDLPKEVRCAVMSMVLRTEAERTARQKQAQMQAQAPARCYDGAVEIACPY